MILRKEVIESLNMKLALPFTGIEQDWELDMADHNRVDEFVSYYQNSSLSEAEKVALMSLIIASYDDLLNLGKEDKTVWGRISDIIKSEGQLFDDLLTYWSLTKEYNSKNLFKITPLIRAIK